MRVLKLTEIQKKLRDKGIPKLAKELKAQTGYNAAVRKQRMNPSEAEVMKDATRPR